MKRRKNTDESKDFLTYGYKALEKLKRFHKERIKEFFSVMGIVYDTKIGRKNISES